MPETITSLIEKLEGAEVGSRELDAEIGRAFNAGVVARFGDYDWRWNNFGVWSGLPKFTTSLDAALALAERVLGEEAALDQLFAVLGTERGGIKRILLALCAAILRAQSEARV